MDHGSPLLLAFVFLAAAVISVPLAKRLGLGSVLGYLVAGAVIGPAVLDLFGTPDEMLHTAEFGVVIMLFLIGLELRPRLLWQMRGAIFGLGGLQVAVSGLALAGIAIAAGWDWRPALAAGLTLALSSTAIVLTSLRERGQTGTPAGRDIFAVLLFQDIAVIPMLALFPLLAVAGAGAAHGAGPMADLPGWAQALANIAAIAVVILGGRLAMRPIFRAVAGTRLQEIFTATALALVVGVALLMQAVGLSPALGAFLAGVVLADSEFRHELEADIEPFRALLLGLFFISVGASIDFGRLAAEPLLILATVGIVILVKVVVLAGAARLLRRRSGEALQIGLALAQGGEFAFVLFAFVADTGVMPAELADRMVLVVALSMAMTPVLLALGQMLAGRLVASDPAKPDYDPAAIEADSPEVVIAGFGRFGQAVGRLLEANGVRTSLLDHSSEHIELLRGFGRKVSYGDAMRVDLLRAAGAEQAKMLVIAIDDREKANELVSLARQHFPHLKLLARARNRWHFYELTNLGVDAIEREVFEGGVRLGVKALRLLGMDAHQAERAGGLFRRHDERMLTEMAPHWGDVDRYRAELLRSQEMMDQLLRADLGIDEDDRRVRAGWDTTSLDAEVARKLAAKST